MKTRNKRKPVRPKTKLGLPDLEQAKAAVVGSLPSRGQFGSQAFSGPGRSRADENRIVALERKVGQQAVEIDFCGDACSMSKSSGGCKR